MAAKAGIVTIDVAADISKLVKGMNRAQSVTKSAVSTMKRLIGAAAIAGIFYKTTNAINSTIDSMDSLAKTASRIGTTTRELSQLQYAADFAGIKTKTLDMAMQRFQRRVAEAAKDTGEAKDAIKGLGIEAKTFTDLPLSEKMGILADKLQGVDSETEKLRISFKLFDSEGTAVLNMLKDGSKGLKDFADQADKAGVTIDDKIAKNAEKAKDAFTSFDFAITGLTNNLTAAVLPAITSTMNAFLDFFNIPRQIGLNELNDQLTELSDKLREAKAETNTGYGGIFSRTSKREITEMENEIRRLVTLINNLQDRKPVEPMGGLVDQTASDSIQSLIDTVLPARAALKRMNAEINALNEFQKLGALSADEYAEAQAGIVKRYEQSIGVGQNVNKNLKESIDLTKQLTDVIGSKLENSMMQTFRSMMDGTANFKDTMISMIKDIIAEIIRLTIVKQVAEGISGGIGGLIGSRANGGQVSGGSSYLVGERGTEVFTPSGSGTISPAGEMNVNIYNQAGASVETKQADSGLDVIIRQLEPMLADNVRRGVSPLGAAIKGM